MLHSGLTDSLPPPSSSRVGTLLAWSMASAPMGVSMQAGLHLLPLRPLAGWLLSHETVQVVPLLHWPWSPSLPASPKRLGPTFADLPVLRDHPTPPVPLSSRRFLLDDYRSNFAETRRSPRVSTQSFVPTPPPIHPSDQRISGFAALGRLTPRRMPPPAIRSRSVWYCTYGFLRTLLAETHLPLGERVPSARVPRGLSS